MADAFAQARKAAGCGWNTSTFRLICSDARISVGMAAGRLDALTNQCRLRVRLGRQCRPDQAAAPVVDHVAAGVAGQSLAERASRGRRTDDPPHWPRAAARRRRRTARRRGWQLQAAAEAASCSISTAPNGASILPSELARSRHRRGDALQPQQRYRPLWRRRGGQRAAAGRNAESGRCAAPETS